MLGTTSRFILVTIILATTSYVTHANDNPPQAEVLHWWSSEGESAAFSVFIEDFKSRGGIYFNSNKRDETTSRGEAIERMARGYPPTLTQWNAGNDLIELNDFGLLQPIKSEKILQKLNDELPAAVLDVVSHQGEILAIPLNVHTENWMWFSQTHLGQSDFKLSGDWRELLLIAKDLADKDIPLLAVGDQRWQIRILFTSVFLGVSRDRYKDFYLVNDINVVDTEGFKTTLEVFNKLAGYSHSFGDGNWNTQVRAVAENRAAANFMGDWARSEFLTLDQQAGEDYGCQLTSVEDPSVLMVVDVFVLNNVEDEREIAGQDLMVDVLTDTENNLRFNALKGSVSPYARPDESELDVCSSQIYTALSDEQVIIPPYQTYFPNSGEYAEIVDQAIYQFWNESLDPNANSDELVKRTVGEFRTILENNAKQIQRTATPSD